MYGMARPRRRPQTLPMRDQRGERLVGRIGSVHAGVETVGQLAGDVAIHRVELDGEPARVLALDPRGLKERDGQLALVRCPSGEIVPGVPDLLERMDLQQRGAVVDREPGYLVQVPRVVQRQGDDESEGDFAVAYHRQPAYQRLPRLFARASTTGRGSYRSGSPPETPRTLYPSCAALPSTCDTTPGASSSFRCGPDME
jgi:hypothetical protein